MGRSAEAKFFVFVIFQGYHNTRWRKVGKCFQRNGRIQSRMSTIGKGVRGGPFLELRNPSILCCYKRNFRKTMWAPNLILLCIFLHVCWFGVLILDLGNFPSKCVFHFPLASSASNPIPVLNCIARTDGRTDDGRMSNWASVCSFAFRIRREGCGREGEREEAPFSKILRRRSHSKILLKVRRRKIFQNRAYEYCQAKPLALSLLAVSFDEKRSYLSKCCNTKQHQKYCLHVLFKAHVHTFHNKKVEHRALLQLNETWTWYLF